jgi:hypothetical protein
MSENAIPPACDCFTVLDVRQSEPLQCDVCDRVFGAHSGGGRRVLSGGEIEALRRQMLIERYNTSPKKSDE